MSSNVKSGVGTDEQTPEQLALAWLALVDAGRSAESWGAAASHFRRAVSDAQWAAAADGVRTPLGAVLSRTLKSEQRATELPGAPDGEYAVLQFASSFEHKRNAVETVTMMRDTDGRWRASGYFIR
jgi:hypothetical protein